jgi:hypothetical protein
VYFTDAFFAILDVGVLDVHLFADTNKRCKSKYHNTQTEIVYLYEGRLKSSWTGGSAPLL